MTQPFLIFPQNDKYLSGKTRRPEYGQSDTNFGCALVTIVPMLLVGVFLVVWTGNLLVENVRLLLGSAVTNGVVRQHYIDYADNADDSTTYHIVYGFTVGGQAYERDQSVPADIHAGYAVGEPVEVRYVPSSPAISRIEGVNTVGSDVGSVLFTAGWALATVIVIVGYVAAHRRLGRLKRAGQVLAAELVSVKTMDEEEFQIEVEVRFRSPSTLQPVTGKRTYVAIHHRNTPMPQVGDPLRVVYADDRVWEVL